MSYFFKLPLTLITLLGLFSCQENKPLVLNADEVIHLQQQNVLKFTSFDGLAPLFKHRDDTLRVINLWATWCKPCVKELPYFEALEKEFRSNKQKAKVILISLDMNEKNLANYITKKDLKTPTYWLDDPDANAWVNKVNQDWDGAIPVTLSIDGTNSLFHRSDFSSYEELKNFVLKK